ncbi:unnamed protein product [Vitrella brassicaformis CCMP3155]|uniref:Uncharacterized protein n=2 Tax=Vitrella brassicaformis TaxID=1169539 RepID=A0A0G4ESA3_VITBC|nr:unnamed protein product [Vitrella brassicaformis CCMP3155]|eukprot:CEM00745.1 unnamed protein product [Vitrella brassicaformis CCMP3155]
MDTLTVFCSACGALSSGVEGTSSRCPANGGGDHEFTLATSGDRAFKDNYGDLPMREAPFSLEDIIIRTASPHVSPAGHALVPPEMHTQEQQQQTEDQQMPPFKSDSFAQTSPSRQLPDPFELEAPPPPPPAFPSVPTKKRVKRFADLSDERLLHTVAGADEEAEGAEDTPTMRSVLDKLRHLTVDQIVTRMQSLKGKRGSGVASPDVLVNVLRLISSSVEGHDAPAPAPARGPRAARKAAPAPSPAQPTARSGRGGGSQRPRGRKSGTGGRVRGDSDEPMLPVGLVDDVEVDKEEDKMPRQPAVETERRPQELPEDVVVCQTPSEASHRDPAGAREEPKEPKHDSEPPEPNQMDDLPDEPDELPPSPGDSQPPPRPDDPSPPPAEAAPAAPAPPPAPPAVDQATKEKSDQRREGGPAATEQLVDPPRDQPRQTDPEQRGGDLCNTGMAEKDESRQAKEDAAPMGDEGLPAGGSLADQTPNQQPSASTCNKTEEGRDVSPSDKAAANPPPARRDDGQGEEEEVGEVESPDEPTPAATKPPSPARGEEKGKSREESKATEEPPAAAATGASPPCRDDKKAKDGEQRGGESHTEAKQEEEQQQQDQQVARSPPAIPVAPAVCLNDEAMLDEDMTPAAAPAPPPAKPPSPLPAEPPREPTPPASPEKGPAAKPPQDTHTANRDKKEDKKGTEDGQKGPAASEEESPAGHGRAGSGDGSVRESEKDDGGRSEVQMSVDGGESTGRNDDRDGDKDKDKNKKKKRARGPSPPADLFDGYTPQLIFTSVRRREIKRRDPNVPPDQLHERVCKSWEAFQQLPQHEQQEFTSQLEACRLGNPHIPLAAFFSNQPVITPIEQREREQRGEGKGEPAAAAAAERPRAATKRGPSPSAAPPSDRAASAASAPDDQQDKPVKKRKYRSREVPPAPLPSLQLPGIASRRSPPGRDDESPQVGVGFLRAHLKPEGATVRYRPMVLDYSSNGGGMVRGSLSVEKYRGKRGAGSGGGAGKGAAASAAAAVALVRELSAWDWWMGKDKNTATAGAAVQYAYKTAPTAYTAWWDAKVIEANHANIHIRFRTAANAPAQTRWLTREQFLPCSVPVRDPPEGVFRITPPGVERDASDLYVGACVCVANEENTLELYDAVILDVFRDGGGRDNGPSVKLFYFVDNGIDDRLKASYVRHKLPYELHPSPLSPARDAPNQQAATPDESYDWTVPRPCDTPKNKEGPSINMTLIPYWIDCPASAHVWRHVDAAIVLPKGAQPAIPDLCGQPGESNNSKREEGGGADDVGRERDDSDSDESSSEEEEQLLESRLAKLPINLDTAADGEPSSPSSEESREKEKKHKKRKQTETKKDKDKAKGEGGGRDRDAHPSHKPPPKKRKKDQQDGGKKSSLSPRFAVSPPRAMVPVKELKPPPKRRHDEGQGEGASDEGGDSSSHADKGRLAAPSIGSSQGCEKAGAGSSEGNWVRRSSRMSQPPMERFFSR